MTEQTGKGVFNITDEAFASDFMVEDAPLLSAASQRAHANLMAASNKARLQRMAVLEDEAKRRAAFLIEDTGTVLGGLGNAGLKFIETTADIAQRGAQTVHRAQSDYAYARVGDPRVDEIYGRYAKFQDEDMALRQQQAALQAAVKDGAMSPSDFTRESAIVFQAQKDLQSTHPSLEEMAILEERVNSEYTNKELMDQSQYYSDRAAQDSDLITKKLSPMINDDNEAPLLAELGENWVAAKPKFAEAGKAFDEGREIAGAVKGAEALVGLMVDVLGSAITNKQASFEFITSMLPYFVAGTVKGGLATVNVAYAGSIYDNGIRDFQEKNDGKHPNAQQTAEIMGWSALAAIAEYAGIKSITKLIKGSKKSGTVTEELAETIAEETSRVKSLAKAGATGTAKVAGVALQEGLTEGFQTAVENNLSKLNTDFDGEAIYTGFGLGVIGGGGLAGGGAAVKGAAKGVLTAAGKLAENQQKKATEYVAKQAERVSLDEIHNTAVESGDFTQVTDKKSATYNPVKLARAYHDRYMKEGLSEEDKKVISGKLNELFAENTLAFEEAFQEFDKLDPRSPAAKRMEKVIGLQARDLDYIKSVNLAAKSLSSNGEVQAAVDTLMGATENSPEVQAAVERVYGSSETGSPITAKEIRKILSNENIEIDDTKRKVFSAQAEAIEQFDLLKSNNQNDVHTDILFGAKASKRTRNRQMLGIVQHEERIKASLSANNPSLVEKTMGAYSEFIAKQVHKLARISTAQKLTEQGITLPADLQEDLESWGLQNADNVSGLIQNIGDEVNALTASYKALQAMEGAKLGSVSSGTLDLSSVTTEAEATAAKIEEIKAKRFEEAKAHKQQREAQEKGSTAPVVETPVETEANVAPVEETESQDVVESRERGRKDANKLGVFTKDMDYNLRMIEENLGKEAAEAYEQAAREQVQKNLAARKAKKVEEAEAKKGPAELKVLAGIAELVKQVLSSGKSIVLNKADYQTKFEKLLLEELGTDHISKNVIRVIFKHLPDNWDVVIATKGHSAAVDIAIEKGSRGYADSDTNTVYLLADNKPNAEMLLHELDHLAQVNSIRLAYTLNDAGYQQLVGIWKHIKEVADTAPKGQVATYTAYILGKLKGYTEIDGPVEDASGSVNPYYINELVTIAKTSPEMRKWLESLSYKVDTETTTVWDAIIKVASKFFGIKSKNSLNSYEAIISISTGYLEGVDLGTKVPWDTGVPVPTDVDAGNYNEKVDEYVDTFVAEEVEEMPDDFSSRFGGEVELNSTVEMNESNEPITYGKENEVDKHLINTFLKFYRKLSPGIKLPRMTIQRVHFTSEHTSSLHRNVDGSVSIRVQYDLTPPDHALALAHELAHMLTSSIFNDVQFTELKAEVDSAYAKWADKNKDNLYSSNNTSEEWLSDQLAAKTIQKMGTKKFAKDHKFPEIINKLLELMAPVFNAIVDMVKTRSGKLPNALITKIWDAKPWEAMYVKTTESSESDVIFISTIPHYSLNPEVETVPAEEGSLPVITGNAELDTLLEVLPEHKLSVAIISAAATGKKFNQDLIEGFIARLTEAHNAKPVERVKSNQKTLKLVGERKTTKVVVEPATELDKLEKLMAKYPKHRISMAVNAMPENMGLLRKTINNHLKTLQAYDIKLTEAKAVNDAKVAEQTAKDTELGLVFKGVRASERVLNNLDGPDKTKLSLTEKPPASQLGKAWLLAINHAKQFFTGKRKDGAASHNLIQITEDFFAEYVLDPMATLAKSPALRKIGAEQKHFANMDKLVEFHTVLMAHLYGQNGENGTEVLKALFKEDESGYRYQDMIKYFSVNGRFDPAVEAAITIAAYDFLANGARDTLVNDTKAIESIIGLEGINLSAMAYNVFGRVGLGKNIVVPTLGGQFLSLMEISPEALAPSNSEENLKNSAGMLIVNLLNSAGFLERNEVNISVYAEVMESMHQTPLNDTKGAGDSKFVEFYRVSTDMDGMMIPAVESIIEANRNTNGMLDKLFSTTSHEVKPTFTPVDAAADRQTKSFMRVPKFLQDILSTHQAKKRHIKEGLDSIFFSLSKNTQERIGGVIENPETVVHAKDVPGVLVNNAAVIKGLEDYNNWREEVLNQPDGLATPFYFTHQVWVNMRMGLKGIINPQSNKNHRALIGVEGSQIEVSLANTKKSVKGREMFFLALAESLGVSSETWGTEARAKINTFIDQKVIVDGVYALARKLTEEEFTAEEEADIEAKILAAVEATGNNVHGLEGLVELTKFRLLQAGKIGPFTSELLVEIDGKTSGVAIGTVQVAAGRTEAATRSMYNRAGLFFKGQYKSLAEFGANPSNDDSYKDLAAEWFKERRKALAEIKEGTVQYQIAEGINELLGGVTEKISESAFIVTSAGRALAKQPLMTLVYGAGIAKVMEAVGFEILGNINKRIAKAVQIENRVEAIKELETISNAVAAILSDSSALVFDLNAVDLKDNLKVGLSRKNEQRLMNTFSSNYRAPLESAIETKYGQFKTNRAAINAAFAIANTMFIKAFEVRVAERTEELRKEGVVVDGITGLPQQEIDLILEELKDIMPIAHSFYSAKEDNIGNGIFLGKTEYLRDANNTLLEQTSKNNKELPQAFKVDATGKKTKKEHSKKSIKMHGARLVFQEIGVAPMIMLIHSLDAAVMSIVLSKLDVINIHDAIIVSQKDPEFAGRVINEAFMEVMDSYSIAEQAHNTLERAATAWGKFLEGRDDAADLTNAVIAANQRSLNSLKVSIAGDGDAASTTYSREDSSAPFHINIQQDLKEISALLVRNKNKYMKEVVYVDQYPFPTGESSYKVAGAAKRTKQSLKNMDKAYRASIPLNDEVNWANAEKLFAPFANETEAKELAKAVEGLYNEELEAVKQDEFKPLSYNEASAYSMALRVLTETLDGLVHKPLALREGLKDKALKSFEDAVHFIRSATAEELAQAMPTGPIETSVFTAPKNFLGSSSYNVDPQSFTDPAMQLESKDLVDVFDSMENVGEVQENVTHSNYLRNVVSELVARTLAKKNTILNLYQKETADTETMGLTNLEDIYIQHQMKGTAPVVSGMLANGIRMSSQEVLAHELVHTVTAWALTEHSPSQRDILRLWKLARTKVTVEDFMEDPALDPKDPSYPIEYAAAKARHDHIFRPKSLDASGASNHLAEFVAMGKTNERFRKVLAGQVFSTNVLSEGWNEGDTFLDKLTRVFAKMMEYLSSLLAGNSSRSMDVRLDILVNELVGLEARQKSKLVQAMNTVTSISNPFLEKTVSIMSSGLGKLAETSLVQNSKSQLVQGVGKLIQFSRINAPGVLIETLEEVQAKYTGTKYGLIQHLITEAKGSTKSNQRFTVLNRMANRMVDQMRKHTSNIVSEVITRDYLTPLNSKIKKAITKVFLKLDVSSLLDSYSLAEISAFLNSDGLALQVELDARIAALSKYGINETFYRKAARSLGYYLANEAGLEHHTLLNAHNIVHLQGTSYSSNLTEAEALEAVKEIDALATLYGISFTNYGTLDLAKGVFDAEMAANPDSNGILTTLVVHSELKDKALQDIFGNDPTQMVKGYTKDILNPYTAIRISTLSREEELTKQGFVRQRSPISRDSTDPQNDEEMFFYVNKNGAPAGYNSGALSITSMNHMGSTLVDIHRELDTYSPVQAAALDSHIMRKAKQGKIHDMFNSAVPEASTASRENVTIPIISPEGKVTGYRYIMNGYTKDTVLERNNNFNDVMGAMAGSIVDKVNSKESNKNIIIALRDQFKEDYAAKSAMYVNIGPDVLDPEMREVYYLLPESTKRIIKEVWDSNSMLVRKDLVPLVFGYRKATVSDMFNVPEKEMGLIHRNAVKTAYMLLGVRAPNKLRMLEKGTMEVAKIVKDIIVVKMGTVTAANIVSNTLLLKILGLSLGDIITWQGEAINGMWKYQKDLRERDNLQVELMVAKRGVSGTAVSIAKVRRMEDRIAELSFDLLSNPVHELVENGVMQSIIEDINPEEDEYSYKSQLTTKMEGVMSHLNPTVKSMLKNVAMTQDTKVYQFMNNAVKMSDFVARYALHKHYTTRTENPLSKAESIEKVVHMFIDYDLPSHKYIQYGNDAGLFWFTKYKLRVQRVILEVLSENTAATIGVMVLQGSLGGLPNIVEGLGQVGGAVGDPFTGVSKFFDIATIEAAQTVVR